MVANLAAAALEEVGEIEDGIAHVRARRMDEEEESSCRCSYAEEPVLGAAVDMAGSGAADAAAAAVTATQTCLPVAVAAGHGGKRMEVLHEGSAAVAVVLVLVLVLAAIEHAADAGSQ